MLVFDDTSYVRITRGGLEQELIKICSLVLFFDFLDTIVRIKNITSSFSPDRLHFDHKDIV